MTINNNLPLTLTYSVAAQRNTVPKNFIPKRYLDVYFRKITCIIQEHFQMRVWPKIQIILWRFAHLSEVKINNYN